MSIVASTLVHDGLVIGADSMVQITGSDDSGRISVIQSYEHAQKLYRFSNRIGVASWGIGNIGPRSIGSFISDCSERLARKADEDAEDAKDPTVEKVAQELFEVFQKVCEEEFKGLHRNGWPELGIFVGGYSPGDPLAEEWEFTLPIHSQPIRVRERDVFGASWRGIVHPFTRLYKGFDPRLDLKKWKVKKEELDPLVLSLVFDAMPIQDAIDFVVFILQTTVNVAKFDAGASSCGGPLWVSLITRDKFQWIQRPEWHVRGLYNQSRSMDHGNKTGI